MGHSSKILTIRPNGTVTKEVLLELGTDPNVEGFIVTCKWKDDCYSTGWSNMNDLELAHALLYIPRYDC